MYIYVLTDPRTNEVRYVGKANDLLVRLRGHINDARLGREQNHKSRWIRSLLTTNLSPEIHPIFPTDEENWARDEREAIAFYRSIGTRLTNVLEGGEGGGVLPLETRAKISASLAGRPLPATTIAKIQEARLRRTHCKRGHEMTDENTMVRKNARGGTVRKCKACQDLHNAKWREDHSTLIGRRKKFCHKGHPLTGNNLVIDFITIKSGRWERHQCRTCKNEASKVAKRRKRAQNAASS